MLDEGSNASDALRTFCLSVIACGCVLLASVWDSAQTTLVTDLIPILGLGLTMVLLALRLIQSPGFDAERFARLLWQRLVFVRGSTSLVSRLKSFNLCLFSTMMQVNVMPILRGRSRAFLSQTRNVRMAVIFSHSALFLIYASIAVLGAMTVFTQRGAEAHGQTLAETHGQTLAEPMSDRSMGMPLKVAQNFMTQLPLHDKTILTVRLVLSLSLIAIAPYLFVAIALGILDLFRAEYENGSTKICESVVADYANSKETKWTLHFLARETVDSRTNEVAPQSGNAVADAGADVNFSQLEKGVCSKFWRLSEPSPFSYWPIQDSDGDEGVNVFKHPVPFTKSLACSDSRAFNLTLAPSDQDSSRGARNDPRFSNDASGASDSARASHSFLETNVALVLLISLALSVALVTQNVAAVLSFTGGVGTTTLMCLIPFFLQRAQIRRSVQTGIATPSTPHTEASDTSISRDETLETRRHTFTHTRADTPAHAQAYAKATAPKHGPRGSSFCLLLTSLVRYLYIRKKASLPCHSPGSFLALL